MKTLLAAATISLLVMVLPAALAGEVTGLTTFTAGTPARAADVNGNFTDVKTAVDDNNARIVVLEVQSAALVSGAASPNISGNITMVNSTATDGIIFKGSVPFLHDFGSLNTFLGENAGNFTMTGLGGNTASGFQALMRNTTGDNNTASGSSALVSNTTGINNTASGSSALVSNTTGGGNTASGRSALQNNTTGSSNTASGVAALLSNTTGNSNIAIGVNAGLNLTTGSNNIDIGNAGVAAESATIRIGSAQTRTFIDAIRGVTTDNANAIPVVIDSLGQLGTVSSSRRFKDDITDMGESSNVLKQLRPVTFHYKSDQNPNGRTLQYGLIAEEVQQIAPNLVAHFTNGEIETVYYQNLTPMLLNEYQKQQHVIDTQTALLAKQTERLAELEQERKLQTARIELLEKQSTRLTAVLGRIERAGLLATAGR